jgi:hypothetical protein
MFDVALKMFVANLGCHACLSGAKYGCIVLLSEMCAQPYVLQPKETVLKFVDITTVFLTIKPPNMVISKQ